MVITLIIIALIVFLIVRKKKKKNAPEPVVVADGGNMSAYEAQQFLDQKNVLHGLPTGKNKQNWQKYYRDRLAAYDVLEKEHQENLIKNDFHITATSSLSITYEGVPNDKPTFFNTLFSKTAVKPTSVIHFDNNSQRIAIINPKRKAIVYLDYDKIIGVRTTERSNTDTTHVGMANRVGNTVVVNANSYSTTTVKYFGLVFEIADVQMPEFYVNLILKPVISDSDEAKKALAFAQDVAAKVRAIR